MPASVAFSEAKIGTNTRLNNNMAAKMQRFGAGAKSGVLSGKATKEFMGTTGSPGLFRPKGVSRDNPITRQQLEKSMGQKFAPMGKRAKARGHIPNLSGGHVPNFANGRPPPWNKDMKMSKV